MHTYILIFMFVYAFHTELLYTNFQSFPLNYKNKKRSLTSSMSHNTTIAFNSANLRASSLPSPFPAPVIKTISCSRDFLGFGSMHFTAEHIIVHKIRPTSTTKSVKSCQNVHFAGFVSVIPVVSVLRS